LTYEEEASPMRRRVGMLTTMVQLLVLDERGSLVTCG